MQHKTSHYIFLSPSDISCTLHHKILLSILLLISLSTSRKNYGMTSSQAFTRYICNKKNMDFIKEYDDEFFNQPTMLYCSIIECLLQPAFTHWLAHHATNTHAQTNKKHNTCISRG
jgi:hypothetical protein